MNYIRKTPKQKFNNFAVTVTLDPYFCSMYNHTEQYDVIISELVKDISLFPTQLKKVYISFELTPKNNIHVHMAIETAFMVTLAVARTLMNIVFPCKKSIYGFNKCLPIYNNFGWLDYINKGQYYQEKFAYAFSDQEEQAQRNFDKI